MDKKEIIALIKEVGQEQNGCINNDGGVCRLLQRR